MTAHHSTQDQVQAVPGESLDRQDVTERRRDLVGTLTIDTAQPFIAPNALASWIAGRWHRDTYDMGIFDMQTPEHRGPQRLASLWLLDTLIQSPAALLEAMIVVRATGLCYHRHARRVGWFKGRAG